MPPCIIRPSLWSRGWPRPTSKRQSGELSVHFQGLWLNAEQRSQLCVNSRKKTSFAVVDSVRGNAFFRNCTAACVGQETGQRKRRASQSEQP